MVKNDALFSYVAPTNIFAWMLMPLRYCMPLPHFVALNRYVIKATHFPLLFGIFLYEKFLLAPSMYEPTDLVENHARARHRGISIAEPGARPVLFSPSIRLREESVVGFRKDRALDEVFRRTPDIATLRTQRRNERRKTQTAIRNWMDQNDGIADTNFSTIDRRENEWQRRLSVNWDRAGGSHRLRHMSEVRSTASDPADLLSLHAVPGLTRDSRFFDVRESQRSPFDAAFKDHTDAEGDDELVTNDDDEEATTNTRGITPVPPGDGMPGRTIVEGTEDEDEDDDDEDGAFFATPIASRFLNVAARSPESGTHMDDEADAEHTAMSPRRMANIAHATSPPKQNSSRRALHSRALSTNTILYDPPHADSSDNDNDDDDDDDNDDDIAPNQSASAMFSPPSPKPPVQQRQPPSRSRPHSSRQSTSSAPGTPTASGQRSPRKLGQQGGAVISGIGAAVAANAASVASAAASRPRPIMPPREHTNTAGASRAAAIFNAAALIDTPVRRAQRRMPSFDTGSDAQSELMTASAVGPTLAGDDGTFNAGVALPGSFTSQMALVTAMNKARATGETDHDRDRMSRLVLARMKTLEESFTYVVRELRQMQKQQQDQHREAMTSGLTSAIMSSSEGEQSDRQRAAAPSIAATQRPRPVAPAKSIATSASSTSSAAAVARRGPVEPLRSLETPTMPRVPLPTPTPPKPAPVPAPAPVVTPETVSPVPLSTPATVVPAASPSLPPVSTPTRAPAAAVPTTQAVPPPPPGGSATPKSPSGSRIPVVASMSCLVSSPPGPGQLGRVSSIGSGTGIPAPGQRHLPRLVGSVSDFGDSESRMPRRAKGKEVERDPVVAGDDEADDTF